MIIFDCTAGNPTGYTCPHAERREHNGSGYTVGEEYCQLQQLDTVPTHMRVGLYISSKMVSITAKIVTSYMCLDDIYSDLATLHISATRDCINLHG